MAIPGKTNRTPWSYRAGTTPLHRFPAGIKLILLLLLSASPVLGLPFTGGAAALIITGALIAGLKITELLAGSLPLIIILLFITLFRALSIDKINIIINIEVLFNGLRLAAGILLCFAAASLFFAVTTVTEIRKTLARCETFLFRRQSRLGLAFALMLGFLPRFFECWENANIAAEARCCKGGLKRITLILPLVAERMLETAAETAEALVARGLKL